MTFRELRNVLNNIPDTNKELDVDISVVCEGVNDEIYYVDIIFQKDTGPFWHFDTLHGSFKHQY